MKDMKDKEQQKSGVEDVLFNLRKAVAQMDLILASLKEGVVVVDKNLNIVFANDAFAGIIGEERLFIVGKNIVDILPLPNFQDGGSINFESMSNIQVIHDFNFSGRKVIVEITTAPLVKMGELVIVVRDITEDKNKEEALRKRTEDTDKLNRFMVDREIKMIELKERIKELELKK